MPKLLGLLLLLPMLVIGGSEKQADPIAAEQDELHDQIEAMKHHPSMLNRTNASPAPAPIAPIKAGTSHHAHGPAQHEGKSGK